MFEYIKLKNFKSFGDIEFNLLDRNNQPKKMGYHGVFISR